MCSQAADGYWDVCDQVIAKQKLGKGLDLHGPELLGEQVSLEVRGCKGQRLRATGWPWSVDLGPGLG